jgi:hypothetical protein
VIKIFNKFLQLNKYYISKYIIYSKSNNRKLICILNMINILRQKEDSIMVIQKASNFLFLVQI